MMYRDNYGNALVQGNRIDVDGSQIRPDGGIVQPGPATYRREGSRGSVTTMSGNPVNDSYMALFANARGPGEQQDIRSRYANSLFAPEQERQRSEMQDAALSRRLQEQRFGLDSEMARGRMGMQGNLANALAQALGQRQQFGGAMDVPPWMQPQSGQAQSQYGQGLDLREPTRNYLMRFLKG